MAAKTGDHITQGFNSSGFCMSSRVLITGASGFIGRHCLRGLAAAGYEVHATTWRDPAPQIPHATWHQVDLLRAREAAALIAQVQPSHLLHFAWYAVPGKYPGAPENLAWCSATIELVAAFARAGGRRAVFAGSCFEYDFSYGYCDEALTCARPNTFYGVCKNATREIVAGYSRQFGLSAAWGRIFHLFGPYESEGRLVPSVIRAMLREELARCSDGRQIRDFLHVEDVAEAFVAILSSDVQGSVNIGSGSPVSVRKVIETIAELMAGRERIRLGALAPRPDDPPLLLPNVRRLREEVGWEPRFSLEQGLVETIEWWRARAGCAEPVR
jgi:nucleoside-diphosphate-sugar epimerase